MIEQRAPGHAHQRLWNPVGQGAHADAKSGSEDHGFGGVDGHFWDFSNRACGGLDHITVIRGGYRWSMP